MTITTWSAKHTRLSRHRSRIGLFWQSVPYGLSAFVWNELSVLCARFSGGLGARAQFVMNLIWLRGSNIWLERGMRFKSSTNIRRQFVWPQMCAIRRISKRCMLVWEIKHIYVRCPTQKFARRSIEKWAMRGGRPEKHSSHVLFVT